MRGAVLALGHGLRCAHKTQGFSPVSDVWKCLTWLQLVFKKNYKKETPTLQPSPGRGESGNKDLSVPCRDGTCYHPNNSML